MRPITFALYFGNRGFFPAEPIASAREEMERAVRRAGFNAIMAPADMTKYGAVETAEEGRKYAEFLKQHEGQYDGIIICLPNFGDENGAVEAFAECNVPILIQAYCDEAHLMAPEHRRDAFCGKFAMMDMFYQMKRKFTIYEPQTVNPDTEAFAEQLRRFGSVCAIVRGMRRFKMGAIGARTTAFKTVRFDEIALERCGIDTETLDLTYVFSKIRALSNDDKEVESKLAYYRRLTDFSDVTEEKCYWIAKTGVVLDSIVDEYKLDALALRCWGEFQQYFGISPCVPVCDLNARGIAAACEMDVNNAIAMRALSLACGQPATVLDWNNNYGHDENKCIVFHCGPAANALLKGGKAKVGRHRILENTYGKDNCTGVNIGRFDDFDFTYASAKTDDGALHLYTGHGTFTDDAVSEDFFGTYGVAEVQGLQTLLRYIGENGYKHHVSLTRGQCKEELQEALGKYLGYSIKMF